jgi:ribosomal protein S18 acetylase RimI-like enzyme
MSAELELRRATDEDAAWLEQLIASDAVAPSLATDAAAGLAEGIAAGELLVAVQRAERVGAVRVAVVNRRSRIAAIRTLMIDPAHRGRGLGVTVVRALADRLLTDDGLHRLEAEVYGFNTAALRTFESAGFVREGIRRRAYDRHGAWQDGISFGLIREDLH